MSNTYPRKLRPPLQPLIQKVRLEANPICPRCNRGDTLNFRLPVAWTQQESLTLRVTLNPGQTVEETSYDNNTYELPIVLQPRSDLTVLYLPIRYTRPGGVPKEPSNRIRRAHLLADKLYPLRQGGLRYIRGRTIPYNQSLHSSAYARELLAVLNKLYWVPTLFDPTEAPDQIMAWLPPIFELEIAGTSDPLWMEPPGHGRVTLGQDHAFATFILAHELAHNLGRRHPNTKDACGAVDPGTDWPEDRTSATIHEEGFDPLAHGGIGEVKLGTAKMDLMTYCARPMSNTWISSFTYRRLFDADSRPSASTIVKAVNEQEAVLVSGTIAKNGDAALDPLILIATTAALPDPPDNGAYCLLFRDGGGVTLQQSCFDMAFVDHLNNPVDDDRFFFVLNFPPGAQQVAVTHQGQQLAALAASGHAPQVSITDPQPGASWSGSQTVRWQSTDADGDPVTHVLVYSPDDRRSWLPIDADVTGGMVDLDMAEMPGGDQAYIRIIAGDGFHSTYADAGPFTVPGKPPRPIILSPENEAYLPLNVSLLLVGEGDDPEDGWLSETAFTWRSDRDGSLGQGPLLDVADLTQGVHQITLTARDGEGNTGADEITIHVGDYPNYLPSVSR